ncbi:MAG TPA: hypothetical protein VF812_00455, partial [Ktedonobacterales bacterium]
DDRPPAPDIERLAQALRDGLLDGLAPEESLAETARRPRAAKASASGADGAKRPAEKTADRAGRGRH